MNWADKIILETYRQWERLGRMHRIRWFQWCSWRRRGGGPHSCAWWPTSPAPPGSSSPWRTPQYSGVVTAKLWGFSAVCWLPGSEWITEERPGATARNCSKIRPACRETGERGESRSFQLPFFSVPTVLPLVAGHLDAVVGPEPDGAGPALDGVVVLKFCCVKKSWTDFG